MPGPPTTPTYTQVPPNSTGNKIDGDQLTVSGNTVVRQNVCIADPNSPSGVASVDPVSGVSMNLMAVSGVLLNAETKGSQSSPAFLPVMDAKDSGRTTLSIYLSRQAGSASETLATSLNIVATGTTYASGFYTVSTGKIFRMQMFSATILSSGATSAYGLARVRATSGTISSGSPVYVNLDIGAFYGTVSGGVDQGASGVGQADQIFIPDGMEFPAGTKIGISYIMNTANSMLTAQIIGFEY